MFKKKQIKEKLGAYEIYMQDIKKRYFRNKFLNAFQKQRLDLFFDRAIEYCKTQKTIIYTKTQYKKDDYTIANSKQLQEYRRIYREFKVLQNQIINDNVLNSKCKKQLLMNLSYLQGHLVGKLFHK